MSLHASVARLAAFAARTFYRLELAGPRAPATGPLLVVANHPSSLLDPALVTLAVGRPTRFLAKAPLFRDPLVGFLVRASGAIPVHRQQDAARDPAPDDAAPSGAPSGTRGERRAGNDAAFRAAETALAAGDAIALFPEGISHDAPALAPLKTGAARLALGAAARLGAAFPLVPVGITLDDRSVFRSRGLLVQGDPVRWDDLAAEAAAAARDGGDVLAPARVRTLTARIAAALDGVTASYATWDEARLVALADAVRDAGHDAADGATDAPVVRLERRRLGARLLARLRAAAGPEADARRAEAEALAADLRRHARLLAALGLAPGDLDARTDARTALGWARRRVHLVLLGALAAAGTLLGWVPYRLTGAVAARIPGTDAADVRGTAKALAGGVLFLAWTALLAAAAGWLVGWWAALLAVVVLPPLLLLALVTTEGWRDAWGDARRFLVLRGRADRVAALRERQTDLAVRVDGLVARLAALPDAAPDDARRDAPHAHPPIAAGTPEG